MLELPNAISHAMAKTVQTDKSELTNTQARFAELGFDATPREIERMQERHGVYIVRHALDAAKQSSGARQFVSNALNNLRAHAPLRQMSRRPRRSAVPTNKVQPANYKPMPIQRDLPYYRRYPKRALTTHRPTLRP